MQNLVHWLEAGTGGRLLRLGAILLGIALVSAIVAWKQFHGPASEAVLLQADVGRQLARGQGFSTLVNYPQCSAFLAARGQRFDAAQPYPELYHAPLYSLTIAGALRCLPEKARARLYADRPSPPDGYAGDYLLLGLNVIFLWGSAFLAYRLGCRLFGTRVGVLASLGLLLSVPLWQQVVLVNGALLSAALVLGAFLALAIHEERVEEERPRSWLWACLLGLLCGLLFLQDYTVGFLLPVVLLHLLLRHRGRVRLLSLGCVLACFLLLAAPWLLRNVAVSGNPLGLAWQELALKAGDSTAEPESWRTSYDTKFPRIDLNKLGNKVLTSLQTDVKERLWSGGGLFFGAFFVAALLYRFRDTRVNRLRWTFFATFVVLLLGQAACNSGEAERLPAVYLSPLLIVFGAGFFFVLVESSPAVAGWPRLAAAGLLCLQGLPLLHDALEPRRIHFHYPPYFPSLFVGLKDELARRGAEGRYGIMADVPAGVAWYGGQRAWAQPLRLRDFYAISTEQPIAELLLSPRTLDRPFFSDLAARPLLPAALAAGANRFGDWGQIYASLFTGRMPVEFPLRVPRRLAENLYVLVDPGLPAPRGK